jgi:hypothetical protein
VGLAELTSTFVSSIDDRIAVIEATGKNGHGNSSHTHQQFKANHNQMQQQSYQEHSAAAAVFSHTQKAATIRDSKSIRNLQ